MADEIHTLNKNEIQDIDYDTYFGEMDLSDEEKEDRKKLAEKFEKIFAILIMVSNFGLLLSLFQSESNMGEKFKSVATRYDVIPFFFKICSNLEYD